MSLPSKKKIHALLASMRALGIQDHDINERFVLGSGKGGQHVNKTANCVQLTHIPTGLVIECHKERSRELNRFLARRQLCEAIKAKQGLPNKKQLDIEKKRKQKKRRQRRSKITE